ncbi:hypothetical protein [Gaopeijia maritima]|uniref:hypothetical protein n=1 Tax=Gaopeijia maritima TaxID=3119007 RepID=UPI00387070A0
MKHPTIFAFVTATGLAIGALPASAQSCYGFPDEFGVYPQVGYLTQGESLGGFAGGVAASGLENVAMRVLYSRPALDGEDAPTGNGIRIEVAASPDFAFGTVCWITAFRQEWYDLAGDDLTNRQVVVGPSFGYGARRAEVSAHFFASPQIRFVGSRGFGNSARDELWAAEAGVALTAQRLFTRVSAVKLQDVDDLQFEVVLGGWIR